MMYESMMHNYIHTRCKYAVYKTNMLGYDLCATCLKTNNTRTAWIFCPSLFGIISFLLVEPVKQRCLVKTGIRPYQPIQSLYTHTAVDICFCCAQVPN